ncbi:hypothetical protein FHS43_003005 [Streptosporangium becharense]|uniref:Uncharacterized protein n=1 Tax=Streptosporangium becharense TaxID=1816182 RepID=A0A7W9IKK6_9ACTN|nr:hypothetical protein [Streptosporangium becharense]MBB2911732.1 hypothetical protein [Streptosporangium becharense]MBB5822450.1 hypothetical protein [Streptosporangium becharense]
MREARAEDARTEARRLIHDLLGEERPGAALLLREASGTLGADRVARCVEFARAAPLTRRSTELAALAGLLVGTRELGEEWWRRERGGKLPAPDEVLRDSTAVDPWTDLTVLEMLAAWIADDVADAIWGRPYAFTDLNSWQAEDRVRLPGDAVPGQRIVVSFDAGGRLDAVVLRRPDGGLGSNLDFDSLRYSRPAEAQWSWGVAAGLGPHRLDEHPDPYGQPVDDRAAAVLHAWALRHGASADRVGPAWRTRGDVVAAIERIDWMWRSGEWFAWWRAVSALVDDEPEQLAIRLEEIAAGA